MKEQHLGFKRNPIFIENPSTGVGRIVNALKKNTAKIFAGPRMQSHLDAARRTKLELDCKAIELVAMQNDHPRDEEAKELAEDMLLEKQIRFTDNQAPKLLKSVRKNAILSYLALIDVRDRDAPPEVKNRLEEWLHEQRKVLEEIRPLMQDPSLVLRKTLSKHIAYLEDTNPTRIDQFAQGRGANDILSLTVRRMDEENLQRHRSRLRRLESVYVKGDSGNTSPSSV